MRPCLVISVDAFNQSGAELLIAIPMTTRHKGIRTHVVVVPPEGGLKEQSYVKCEDVRSLSKERFHARWGAVSASTLVRVEDCLRILMGL